MDKVTEYARKFKEDQNILKVLTKESISVIYAGKKPTQYVLLAIVIFESQKKEKTFGIDNKTNNLKIKTAPRRINFGLKVCDEADLRDFYRKTIFPLIDKVTNNEEMC